MLLSFVLPEVLLAVALLFVITTVAVPVNLGTTAQVIGLVTFQVSYPAVLVRARLATIGPQYEEAAMDLGASPLGALRRIILPMLMPAIFASTVLVFADVIDDFVLVRYLSGDAVYRARLGEDLQHRARRADACAQCAGDAAATGRADRHCDRLPGVPTYDPLGHDHQRPRNRRLRRRGVTTRFTMSSEAALCPTQQAFGSWRRTTPAERSGLLLRAADVLEAHAEELKSPDTPVLGHSASARAENCRPRPRSAVG